MSAPVLHNGSFGLGIGALIQKSLVVQVKTITIRRTDQNIFAVVGGPEHFPYQIGHAKTLGKCGHGPLILTTLPVLRAVANGPITIQPKRDPVVIAENNFTHEATIRFLPQIIALGVVGAESSVWIDIAENHRVIDGVGFVANTGAWHSFFDKFNDSKTKIELAFPARYLNNTTEGLDDFCVNITKGLEQEHTAMVVINRVPAEPITIDPEVHSARSKRSLLDDKRN